MDIISLLSDINIHFFHGGNLKKIIYDQYITIQYTLDISIRVQLIQRFVDILEIL